MCSPISSAHQSTSILFRLKKPVPKWNPGKWKDGPKPAGCHPHGSNAERNSLSELSTSQRPFPGVGLIVPIAAGGDGEGGDLFRHLASKPMRFRFLFLRVSRLVSSETKEPSKSILGVPL